MRFLQRRFTVPTRPEDYVPVERVLPPGADPWDHMNDPEVENLHGVWWHSAEVPPANHDCWVQTNVWINLLQIQRCACGAIRDNRGRKWCERNSTRRDRERAAR